MVDGAAKPAMELLILQPTPFCNIDCSYCYLPGRNLKGRMSDQVIAAACSRVVEAGRVGERISVVWHAGEPLVLPIGYYQRAIAIIAGLMPVGTLVEHHFQTNATLIDDDWCRFFSRPGIKVGVSIDGPRALHDRHRRTRTGAGTFARVMAGLKLLVSAGVPFHVISVLTRDALHFPDEFYDFYAANGIERVCFNIEEIEGNNAKSSLSDARAEDLYTRFLERFMQRMSEHGVVKSVREFDQALGRVMSRAGRDHMRNQQAVPFLILSVAMNGDYTTFSPELLGMTHERWGDFVIGNVLADSLADAECSEKFRALDSEIAHGLARCREACAYYDLCGGGAPANKLFETGRFDSTETLYCRYTVKLTTEVILSAIERDGTATRLMRTEPFV